MTAEGALLLHLHCAPLLRDLAADLALWWGHSLQGLLQHADDREGSHEPSAQQGGGLLRVTLARTQDLKMVCHEPYAHCMSHARPPAPRDTLSG